MHISVQIYDFYRKLTEYKANFLCILTQVSQVESIFMWVCHNINLGADYTDFFALLNNSSRIARNPSTGFKPSACLDDMVNTK